MTTKLNSYNLMVNDWIALSDIVSPELSDAPKYARVISVLHIEGLPNDQVMLSFGGKFENVATSVANIYASELTHEILAKNGWYEEKNAKGLWVYDESRGKENEDELSDFWFEYYNGHLAVKVKDSCKDKYGEYDGPCHAVTQLQNILRICGMVEIADKFNL